MTNLRRQFRDSFHELKDVKALAMTAMLLAVAVVLGFYTLQIGRASCRERVLVTG